MMKKNLLLVSLMFLAGTLTAQNLVVGSTDVVRLGGYARDAYLIEGGANSFFAISGTNNITADHPLVGSLIDADFRSIYFLKYNQDGLPLGAGFIRGTYSPAYAASYKGGLTIVANASEPVLASGYVIDIPASSHVEFIASYTEDLAIRKIVNVWALTANQYMYSKAIMDPNDGSIYLYGTGSQPVDLRDFGTLGEDLQTPNDYAYVVKYNADLDLQWVYQVGFDAAQSQYPYFNNLHLCPGADGSVLLSGIYDAQCSPLINGTSLAVHSENQGTFAVKLDQGGNPQWVQEGSTGYGYNSGVFKGFGLPNGDFVLAGRTNSGSYTLGDASFVFTDQYSNNQFVYRINSTGNVLWDNKFEAQGPGGEYEKKGAKSELMSSYIENDAIMWNNRLLYLAGQYTNPAFSVAGRIQSLTYPYGIYVAALDIRDGTEVWGYSLSSDDAVIHGFDCDQTGNISLMGSNYRTQDLYGITGEAVVDGNFLFNVGLDYNGKVLWYANASLVNPPYYNLDGADLVVLPNGQVFNSMSMSVANDILIGESVIGEAEYANTSWVVNLGSDVALGGIVTDADENPVYPGYVKAVKSAFWGCYPVVDSVMLQDDGSYLFNGLYPGNYTLLAVADQSAYPYALPTYYGDQTAWDGLGFHDLIPKFSALDYNIKLFEVAPMSGGSGQMSGTIIYAEEARSMKKGTGARPAKKASVILLKKAKKSTMAGEVVAYVETDEFGIFAFHNVPDGDYLLHVEVPGLDMLETHEVTVVDDQIISGLDYTISDNGIFIGWGVGVSLLKNETLNIYPNPGPGLILMDLPEAGEYSITIYTTDGRLVMKQVISSQGGARSFDISGERDGIYLIRIEGPDTDASIKYIKR